MLEHKEGEEQQDENYSDQLEKHVVTSLYYKAAELMHCKSFVLIKNWVKKKCISSMCHCRAASNKTFLVTEGKVVVKFKIK